MNKIFFSYNEKDRKTALRIYGELKSRGAACWIAPDDVTVGRDFADDIAEQIQSCDYFLLLVSEHSQKSAQVLNELNMATTYRKNIIPILLDNAPMSGSFLYYIGSKHWLKLYDNFDQTMTVLVGDLCQLEESPAVRNYEDTESVSRQHAISSKMDHETEHPENKEKENNDGCIWGMIWAARGYLVMLGLSITMMIGYGIAGDMQGAMEGAKATAAGMIVIPLSGLIIFIAGLSANDFNFKKTVKETKKVILYIIKCIFYGAD